MESSERIWTYLKWIQINSHEHSIQLNPISNEYSSYKVKSTNEAFPLYL